MQVAAGFYQNADSQGMAEYESSDTMEEETALEPVIGAAIISALIVVILVLVAIVAVVAKRKISESKS